MLATLSPSFLTSDAGHNNAQGTKPEVPRELDQRNWLRVTKCETREILNSEIDYAAMHNDRHLFTLSDNTDVLSVINEQESNRFVFSIRLFTMGPLDHRNMCAEIYGALKETH